jgi:hypothetical protein
MGAIYNTITGLTEFSSFAFNEAYQMPPTAQGTNATTLTNFMASEGTNPVFESSNGPISTEGSWRFNTIPLVSNCRIKHQAGFGTRTGVHELISTDNYTVGVWVKVHSVTSLNGTGIAPAFHRATTTEGGSTYSNYSFNLDFDPATNTYGFGYTNTLALNPYQYTTTDENNNPIVTNKWYFLAIRSVLSGTTRTVKFYLNGVVKFTVVNTDFSSGYINQMVWGLASPGNTGIDCNIANWFLGTSANISEADIVSIYNSAGQSINTAQPMTASAMMTEPTIVVQAGDHVEVTTSFVASATLPGSVSVQASQNINNQISETLNASATIGDNVTINSSMDESFGAVEMTASALFVDPIVPREAMTASALMGNASPTIAPNYYNLVKSKNPIFYIKDGTKPTTGYGSADFGTGTFDSAILTGNAGVPLSSIGTGNAWFIQPESSASLHQIVFNGAAGVQALKNAHTSKNFAYEIWLKPTSDFGSIDGNNSQPLIANSAFGIYASGTPGSFSTNFLSIILSGATTEYTHLISKTAYNSYLSLNNWHHLLFNCKDNGSTITTELWIDGNIVSTNTAAFTINTSTINSITGLTFFGRTSAGGFPFGTPYFDEVAIYPQSLTNSQIIDNYSFVQNNSPDKNIVSSAKTATALMVNATVLIASSINNQETPATATSLFVQPVITSQRTINAAADPMLASATNTDATAYWGKTFYATPMISSAESKEGFVLNDIYYNYVQANIAPWRYVTFDAANTSFDYGSDNDYSVVPTTVGGTIVNPDFGINGKSAKTAGLSYVTDGVILKESDWDDSWGTGANSYHSAFWFQRATDDNSTTGLRVLWNLNGYKDSQHIVIYQYENKIYVQFNNASGQWIQIDTGTLNIFDYERHFIVFEFKHINANNNTINLYVDAILKATANINSYIVTTTNAQDAYSQLIYGPNNEANSLPRLSVGCLITPFGATALPVAPANTKLIIDEIYWDKNAITQTEVTNLFNIMPNKFNINKVAEPMLASDEFVMPTFITSVNFVTVPLTASATAVQPVIAANRQVVSVANVMTATSLMGNAVVNENRTLVSDIMIATATFNNPGVQITVSGGPMLASVELANRTIGSNQLVAFDGILKINGNVPWTRVQPWATWLRATDSNSIIPTKEVV